MKKQIRKALYNLYIDVRNYGDAAYTCRDDEEVAGWGEYARETAQKAQQLGASDTAITSVWKRAMTESFREYNI